MESTQQGITHVKRSRHTWLMSVVLMLGVGVGGPSVGAAPTTAGPNRTMQNESLTLQDPRGLASTSTEDLLLEKGLITMDDWVRIKAEEERRAVDRVAVAEYAGNATWYERLSMFGYGQFRFNNSVNPGELRNYHDKSVGTAENGAQPGFFFRRIRWVVTGQVSDHVSVFFQPDMASSINSNESTHVMSMRDAFADWNFDSGKEHRLRVGLQRVPCSFDNWQASRVRMAMDRTDATNSCGPSERDMGVAYMWSPKIAQQRYKQMLDYGYGPGDYGVFHLQIYNGQGLNKAETNAGKHVGMRVSWPWELPGGYLMETGMNAMYGTFVVTPGSTSSTAPVETRASLWSTVDTDSKQHSVRKEFLDERVNAYIYFPPQPFGFIAEYVVGRGPRRGQDGVIRDSPLNGGYLQAHYQFKYNPLWGMSGGLANVYSRWQAYNGGVKFETGAPSDNMQAIETGVAWQPDPQWEVTIAHEYRQEQSLFKMNSRAASAPSTSEQFYTNGHLLRLQMIWFWN